MARRLKLDGLLEAGQAELARQHRWERMRGLWRRWARWWRSLTPHVKTAAKIAGAAATIASALPTVVRGLRDAWGLFRARDVGPAELPKTGQPTTATDFVSKPTPEPKPPTQGRKP